MFFQRDREASVAAASEAALQHACRGRHQGCGEELRGQEGEARRVGDVRLVPAEVRLEAVIKIQKLRNAL